MREKNFEEGVTLEAATNSKANSGTVPTEVPAQAPAQMINPFVLFRQQNSSGGGTLFHGPTVKCDYRSGEWTRSRGETETLISPDERFKVYPQGMIDIWTKYVDGKRVDRKVYRTILGEMAPRREELGDMDEDGWERNGKKPKDPWQRMVLLPMRSAGEDDEVCAFRATAMSAINEIGELVGMYGEADRKGRVPVIKPENRNFESTHGSLIYVPVFRLIGWEFWEKDTPAPEAAPVLIPTLSTTAAPAKQAAITARKAPDLSSDMDDEIPF